MFPSTLAPKFLSTLSAGGCGGHSMRRKSNSKYKCQISIANEHTDTFYFVHYEFKDPVNAIYIIAFWVRWPCISCSVGRVGDRESLFILFHWLVIFVFLSNQPGWLKNSWEFVKKTCFCIWWTFLNIFLPFRSFKISSKW